MSLYDAVVRHRAIETIVTRGSGKSQEKKYWRFRVDRWYGGIVTADAVGCGLLCKFCWVSDRVTLRPAHAGRFYAAECAADILGEMAIRKGLRQLRVSGGEPTIGKDHLVHLLERLQGKDLLFMLETNGILLGQDQRFSGELSRFPFLHVRVSLKGCNEDEFTRLTGAKPEGFVLQLKALENLFEAGVPCHPAVMVSFSSQNSLRRLVERVRKISQSLAKELEVEELILYPTVKRKIQKHGLTNYRSHMPNRLPKELV